MNRKKLTALRKSHGLTQEQLAKLVGVTTSAVSNYEQGTRLPKEETLIKLSNHFNVSIDYLMDNESEEQTATIEDFLCVLNTEIRKKPITIEGRVLNETQLTGLMTLIRDGIESMHL
ncbi:MAG: helix-turn-helix domain-containing protein [Oscillospiraceae bacterium]|nr:helix-turn-helix domain-containing protein [Oscillospiraceae bacterium]